MTMKLFPNSKQYLNPYPFFKKMRCDYPIVYDDSQQVWGIYRYEDVNRIITDYKIFSSDFSQSNNSQLEQRPKTLLTSDPPIHKNLRNLVFKAFSPKVIQDMEPRITQIVNELINNMKNKSQIELIQDFAAPLPTIVIAEMLGIPTEDRGMFKNWADKLLSTEGEFNLNNRPDRQTVLEEMNQYFRQIIKQRRIHMGADLISALIRAEIDGERLSEIELLSFCEILLLAGHITTVNLIGNAIWSFTERPQILEQIRCNQTLIPSAIEEVLRYKSPIQLVARVAKQDVKIGDQMLKEGDRILAWIGSANHDENQFENANQFCVNRNPNPHIAFGHGIHFCLGAPLARLETRIGLTSLLNTFSHIQRNPTVTLESTGSFLIYGLKYLHLEVER
ncbi:cytochrome P450 [Bacillus cereus]